MSLSTEGTDLLASDFSQVCTREDPGQKRVAVDLFWAWPIVILILLGRRDKGFLVPPHILYVCPGRRECRSTQSNVTARPHE